MEEQATAATRDISNNSPPGLFARGSVPGYSRGASMPSKPA